NSVKLEFEYELPQNYSSGGKYPILIQKQPGTKDFETTLQINGRTKENFPLNADKELKLPL
ncbi:hypothetical protein INO43_13415, partial [Staphylococcus aureus]|nr:hypothetical protein [Staphylococcus aureus]